MNDTLRGVGFMFLASFLFAVMLVFVKLLPGIPVLEIILFRGLIAIAICLYALQKAGIPPLGNRRVLLLIRGAVGTLGLGMNFYLIQTVPLATASTLTYLAPVCTTILAIFLLKEKVRPIQFAFFAVSFAGVVVVQGFDPRIAPWHLLFGLATSLVMGLAYNSVRKLGETEHPLVIVFYFPLISVPVAAVWSVFNWVQPQGIEWLYLLLIGITSQTAQYFMTRSYLLAETGTVSIVNFTGIIYAIVLGFIIFGESFNLMTYFGMFLVMVGISCNVLYRQSKGQKKVAKDAALEVREI